jgi:D-psicose/D-tagatose/L-ribulose 3-epimerase
LRLHLPTAVLALLLVGGPPAQERIQVGICAPLKDIEVARAAGFDYVELPTTEVAALSNEDFENALQRVKQGGFPVAVTNLFLPAALKVTGPQIDPAEQTRYVAAAFERLSRLGVEIVVFGSGGARRVPDGFSRDEAFKQLVDFGRRVAVEARRHRIVVAVEPLRQQETNIINSAAEGLELVKAVDDPNFRLMIDFYHLASEQEDATVVLKAREYLVHLHVANPVGRVFPLVWTEYEYAPFFDSLRAIGYKKRISVEASTRDFPSDAPRAISLLRHAFER